jgi:competence protein ComEA
VSSLHRQPSWDLGESPLAAVRERVSGAARELGSGAVKALAVFAVVVAVIAAVLAWQARPGVEPLGPGKPSAAAGGVATSGPAASPSTDVVVAVSGRVRRPGLVRLPVGARVADAIEAAGGVLPGTDLSLVNLARTVTDGELILVGITPPPGASAPPGGAGGPAGPVNLNTATAAQLQDLPGVGPVLAQRIIDYRDQHGGFKSVADLRKVSGIGDARYNELKDRVAV